MPEVRTCLIMPEYVSIPKSAWMAFVLHVPIVIPCLHENVFTYFKKVYGLKERDTVSWSDKILVVLY